MRKILDAEGAANKLLSELSISEYPIDVEYIAQCKNIQIVSSKIDDEVSGFLHRNLEYILIGVNSDHNYKRQRFTIGHELGHFSLHLDNPEETFIDKIPSSAFFARGRESSRGIDQKEIEANAFAAALLMPENLIRKCLEKYSVKYSSIEDIAWRMAKDFDVSEQAMTLRLIKLKIFNL